MPANSLSLRPIRKSQPTDLPNLSAAFEEAPQWDVLGIGQAMVDFAAAVDDAVLQSLGVEKGGRK